MKANELRIGNLYQIGDSIYKVNHIYNDAFAGEFIKKASGDYTNGGRKSPIDLSPEILEKCGFEKVTQLGGNHYGNPTNNIILQEQEDGGYAFFGSECIHGKSNKYLHELQNLVYAITGEELTFNNF